MTVRDYRRVIVGLGLASVLVGCDAAQNVMSGSLPQRATVRAHQLSGSNGPLLYVLGPCGGICILTYPDGQYVAGIQNLGAPPSCTDRKGNVFALLGVGESAGYIYEYAHGGTQPIATLDDAGFPDSCSVDQTTGNLAVANYFAPGSGFGHGNIAIYAGGQGPPTYYKDSNIYWYTSCAYDSHGNLLVDGNSEGSLPFAFLHKGSTSFTDITLSKHVEYGPIQWDGKYFAIGYAPGDTVYRVAVSGSVATVVGQVRLKEPDIRPIEAPFFVEGRTLLAPFSHDGRRDGFLGLWKYPAGGYPDRILKRFDGQKLSWNASGVIVSTVQSR